MLIGGPLKAILTAKTYAECAEEGLKLWEADAGMRKLINELNNHPDSQENLINREFGETDD